MKEDINKALEVLRKGGVILYPTDTIWGLGCDATNAEAVSKVFNIKQRTDNKSLIILLDTSARISSYINDVPDVAYQIMDYATKPTTLILDGAKNLATNVINPDDESVGIRIADNDFCQQLINRFRKPIVSTSANISGQPHPKDFHEISEDIKQHVDYIVQHSQDDVCNKKPSAIIKVKKDGQIKIIRE